MANLRMSDDTKPLPPAGEYVNCEPKGFLGRRLVLLVDGSGGGGELTEPSPEREEVRTERVDIVRSANWLCYLLLIGLYLLLGY